MSFVFPGKVGNQAVTHHTLQPNQRPRFRYSQMTFYLTADARMKLFGTVTPRVLQRSWTWSDKTCKLGLAAQFCLFLRRLGTGHCVSIYVLGGSTTLGISAWGKLWYQQLEDWLNLRLPCVGGKHRIRAHAYSGAGSAHHLDNIPTLTAKFKAMGALDLIMLETGANDFVLSDAPKAEALVYSLAAVQPHAAFMMLSTVPRDYEGGFLPVRYEDMPEAKIHFPISKHLHLPFLSIPFALVNSPAKSGNASSNLYAEGARDPASPLFQGGRHCGDKCMIYPDGLHLSATGHTLLASAVVIFWLTMLPHVRGMNVSASPIDVVALTNHTLFPDAKGLTETRPPLLVHSFMESSLPAGFIPPEGWEFVNERERFGLAAFGICNESRSEEVDPCSDPLPMVTGGSTFVLGLLRSYKSMGIALVQAPPGFAFDVCEAPLATPNSTCVVDGIFHEKFPWPVSLPAHVHMHLIPTNNNQSTVKFPLTLSLHIASPALAAQLTSKTSTFINATGQRAVQPPLRGRQKTKIHGWYSLA